MYLQSSVSSGCHQGNSEQNTFSFHRSSLCFVHPVFKLDLYQFACFSQNYLLHLLRNNEIKRPVSHQFIILNFSWNPHGNFKRKTGSTKPLFIFLFARIKLLQFFFTTPNKTDYLIIRLSNFQKKNRIKNCTVK